MDSIDKIEDEIWMQIFQKVGSFNDFFSLDSTCKKFSRIINKMGFFRKCSLEIDHSVDVSTILNSSRKYGTLKFNKRSLHAAEYQILNKFQNSLVALHFSKTSLSDRDLVEIFKLKNLKQISLFEVQLELLGTLQPLTVPITLKKITLVNCDTRYLYLLHNRITKLVFSFDNSVPVNLLVAQRNLKHLEVSARNDNDWAFLRYENFPQLGLQLESIVFKRISFSQFCTALPLIQSQVTTLVHLTIRTRMMLFSQIATILNTCRILESFEVNSSGKFHIDNGRVRPHLNLKKLNLLLCLNEWRQANQDVFFQSFPNLVELRISSDSFITQNIVETIAQHSPKIRTLMISFEASDFQEKIFQNLRAFEVPLTSYSEFRRLRLSLKKFLYCHPQLEVLSFEICDENFLFYIIQRMKRLKFLSIFNGQCLKVDSLDICYPYIKLLKQMKELRISRYVTNNDVTRICGEVPDFDLVLSQFE